MFSSEDTELPNSTIARWFGVFRNSRIDPALELGGGRPPIGDPGMIVQVDETLIGRRKYNRGRVVSGTWVLGMIADDGALRLEICERRDAATLTEMIQRHVAAGSIVHTDGWRAYRGLSDLGYTHQVVNHSVEFVADDGAHTQAIESQWRSLRRRISPGGRRHDEIGDYLIEHIWRRKCRLEGRDPSADLIRHLKY